MFLSHKNILLERIQPTLAVSLLKRALTELTRQAYPGHFNCAWLLILYKCQFSKINKSETHMLWEFREDANAIDTERRAVNFKLEDQEIFQNAGMAFDLSHAG